MQQSRTTDLVTLTADIAAAYVGANKIPPTVVAFLISSIHVSAARFDVAKAILN